ncbi:MAG: serine/threonine protein kinase [Victivallaceae bacterium]|nr:serine/threonine protein kinase [Victivallaceae bacterium]
MDKTNSDEFDEQITPEEELSATEDTEEHIVVTQTVAVTEQSTNSYHTLANLSQKPANKYKFERSLGMGGMKAVLQVWNMDTARSVAMAVILDSDDRPAEDIQRFLNEARITAMLEHPNIVPVHEIGVDKSGSPYFTMKLLRGKTLAKLIKDLKAGNLNRKNFDLQRILRIYVKICNAIAFCHSKNIIHLDIKPDNIHIGDFGEVLVLDWGLAKDLNFDDDNIDEVKIKKPVEDDITLDKTMDGIAKGTPGYMAPEQAAGKNRERDVRSDIYALGAILYFILTWQKPVTGANAKQVMINTVQGNIVTPRKAKRENKSGLDIPPALEAIIMKAMSLYRADRYQSVNELRSDIFSFIGGFATQAEAPGVAKRSVMFINRNYVKIVFATMLAVIIAMIILYLTGKIVISV